METAYPTRQDRVPRSPGPRTPVARSCPKQSTHLTMGSQRVELPPPPEPVLVSTWRASSSARHCSVTARLCKQGAGQWERAAAAASTAYGTRPENAARRRPGSARCRHPPVRPGPWGEMPSIPSEHTEHNGHTARTYRTYRPNPKQAPTRSDIPIDRDNRQ